MRFWGLIQRRLLTLFPSYRPERHYMRGPGPEMAGTARSPVRRPQPGRKTRWRIQGNAANDGHVRVEGWKRWTVSTKRSEGRVSNPRLPVK